MRVLIVGAGSVGQVYGFCLKRGGADVDVYVRPKYAQTAARGFSLFDRKKGLTDPHRFTPSRVLVDPDALAEERYDVVLVCIPSDGLRGEWFGPFATALGEATLVSLSPALKDREFIARFLAPELVGWGLITGVCYPAPLPGEEASEPGTAFWFPPMTPALFQGPPDAVDPLVQALSRGGMQARHVDDVAHKASFASAVLIPVVAVMEARDWSFSAMRSDRDAMRRLHLAIGEALECVERVLGAKRPIATRLLSPWTLGAMTRLAGVVPPFDMQTYLRVHFTKVGAQTRLFLQDYIARREEDGSASPALSELLEALRRLDRGT
jgi:ketopantoate reductase